MAKKKAKINIEAMSKNTDSKGCDHYECKTCGYQTSVRAEELDASLIEALVWMEDINDRFGILDIPCTKAAQLRLHPDKLIRIPDSIIGSRVYSKLKYWQFVNETKQKGVWKLNAKLAKEFLYHEKPMCHHVYVCEDKPVGQSYETVTRAGIERASYAA